MTHGTFDTFKTQPPVPVTDMGAAGRQRRASTTQQRSYRPDTTAAQDMMLTVGDVARQLRVSQRTVNRMIKNGGLKCCRIGRIVRISREHLRAFIINTEA